MRRDRAGGWSFASHPTLPEDRGDVLDVHRLAYCAASRTAEAQVLDARNEIEAHVAPRKAAQ